MMMRRLEMMLGNLKMTLFDLCFFPCVPPYVDGNAGLHLSDAVTDHECTRRCC